MDEVTRGPSASPLYFRFVSATVADTMTFIGQKRTWPYASLEGEHEKRLVEKNSR